MKLRIVLKDGAKNSKGRVSFCSEVNAENYKEISFLLRDLENKGLPIKKAIKEFNVGTSYWDMALGG